jgi:hypothetical protein
MVYLYDTREHDGKNQHILDVFDKMKISYKKKKLDYCDYSFLIPANEELNIPRDLDFSHLVALERKASLEEILSNISTERDRLKKEFALGPKDKVLLIEGGSYSDMLKGNYNSKYSSKSFWATLHSFWHEYNIPFVFMPNQTESAYFIRGYFQYWLRNYLKNC